MGKDIVTGVLDVVHAIGTLIADGQAITAFFQHNQTRYGWAKSCASRCGGWSRRVLAQRSYRLSSLVSSPGP